MQKQHYILVFIGALLLYFISTGISYFAFVTFGSMRASVSVNESVPEMDEEGNFIVDESLPKTEVCPINGKLYTKPERAVWEKRRPMGVMIENSTEARPQSGLSSADIVYEAVAEGGITRFMGVYYCGIAENTSFAPVRSARTYFLDWISEYGPNPLYVHVGGANCSADASGTCTTPARAQSLEQIEKYGWGGSSGNDLNQFRISFPTCYRNPDRLNHPVATEHQMVCESSKLYDIASKDGWNFEDENNVAWNEDYVSWKFADDAQPGDRGIVDTIEFGFWERYSTFNVLWEYDVNTNSYKRFNGGKAHTDLESGEQLSAKNVVVQFTDETSLNDIHKHILYDTISSGDVLIFQNGDVVKGSWKKASRTARTKFFDQKGKEISFVRGTIWIEIVPTGNNVSF